MNWKAWTQLGLDKSDQRYQLLHKGRFVRPVFNALALAAGLYLVATAFGVRSQVFPKDLLMLCGGVIACFFLLRAKDPSAGVIMMLVTLNNTAAFVVSGYGMHGPAPAIFALSIVLCGLIVGRFYIGGWFAITLASFLFALLVDGTFRWAEWPILAAWVGCLALVAGLTALFSSELDRLLSDGKASETRERERILEERTRIAREIHDTLAQGFTGIMMQLNAAEGAADSGGVRGHVVKARELAAKSLEEARESVWSLRPRAPSASLADAISEIGKGLTEDSKIEFSMEVQGQETQLEPGALYELTRIAQEAITNAVRHSSARHIRVKLDFTNGLEMRICDDGKGINGATEGFGITGMRERASKIGATIDLKEWNPGLIVEVNLEPVK